MGAWGRARGSIGAVVEVVLSVVGAEHVTAPASCVLLGFLSDLGVLTLGRAKRRAPGAGRSRLGYGA